jgi:hypothetical protein
VPSPKRKSRRSPLQRLSDQRRSVALAGLAVGAVFSAAILRRKRRGGEAEFGQLPPTEPFASAEPEVAATATAEAPAAAGDETTEPSVEPATADAEPATADAEPEPADAEAEPATKTAEAEPSQPSAEAASSSISDPATGELSAEEASILAVLAQDGRGDDDRTVIAVATSLERESADVADVLRKLSAEGVVAGELYTAAGDKIWAVTERGVRRLGAQH